MTNAADKETPIEGIKACVFDAYGTLFDFAAAADRLGIPAASISFQSSNAWDAYAASAFGMKVVWCNRYGQRAERLPGKPDRQIQSLAELPRLVGA